MVENGKLRSVVYPCMEDYPMKLEQIEQAIMVAKTKSISLAAESLFISQPNLSLSIKKLEEEIGYPIFERTNKGVEVTPLGQNFIDLAKLIMLQIRQLQPQQLIQPLDAPRQQDHIKRQVTEPGHLLGGGQARSQRIRFCVGHRGSFLKALLE